MISNYEKQVYTAVSGKVIGVYLGRPYEGWKKEDIQKKWGVIDRYVHEDQNVPLVVSDDDISGTFTFFRALEDSGLYENTPDFFYGKTWLNYLLEQQTVLWWGGMSLSTEHTAFLRLKQGIESPESGSAKRNGKEVSEQIGAQIFIDAFGMVAPGNPGLAARLARQAASVSHDGEAVYAAQVVAVMVSLAFEEKDMNRLLDRAVTFIPADSRIAAVHRDVRKWVAEFPDWNGTYRKIKEKYGYQIYGGNCHVIPNHALMVMAWAYGQNDFFRCMSIACTAGWDTDCNAGNVGSVAALVAGLEHLNDRYEFQAPFGDRIRIPTADGTDSVCDSLRVAFEIARIGRRIMKMPEFPAPKHGAFHSFEMPEALHGYLPEENKYELRGNARVSNEGGHALKIDYTVGTGRTAVVSTPVSVEPDFSGAYSSVSTPLIYRGNIVRVNGKFLEGFPVFRLFVRGVAGELAYSEPVSCSGDGSFSFEWKIELDAMLLHFGFEVSSDVRLSGSVRIDSVDFGGRSEVNWHKPDPCPYELKSVPGWISSMDYTRNAFSNDPHPEHLSFGKNSGCGLFVTGNRFWRNVSISCGFQIHAADRAGILFDYQGAQRWNGVLFTDGKVRLTHCLYGEKILAEIPFELPENTEIQLDISEKCGMISVEINGKTVLTGTEPELVRGGAGLLVDTGLAAFRNMKITADWEHQL